MKQASKSSKRVEFLDLISESITHEDIFGTLNYKKKSEDQIKQFIYPHLVRDLTNYLVSEGEDDKEHLLLVVIAGNAPKAEFTDLAYKRIEEFENSNN